MLQFAIKNDIQGVSDLMIVLSIVCVCVCGCKGQGIITFTTITTFKEPFDAFGHPYCMTWLEIGKCVCVGGGRGGHTL